MPVIAKVDVTVWTFVLQTFLALHPLQVDW